MNPATQLARTVLAELVHQGVREVVLAPGSRSAPLAFAVLDLARAGRVRLHVRIDERSAGFLALGLAKVSGDPVAVICTSGTAVANLAPAVVEASYSAVPLVVVSADRPPETRGVGAPQTIDQIEFFGPTVRFFADLAPIHEIDRRDATDHEAPIRAAVGRAVLAALGAGDPGSHDRGAPHAGPVHLNVAFRLPLVPPVGSAPDWVGAKSAGSAGPPRVRRPPLSGCGSRPIDQVIGPVPARGVVLVGDLPGTGLRGPHQWLAELAAACGWPVLAEPSANMSAAPTALAHGVLLAGSPVFLAEHTPDLIVTAGLFGLSRPTMELVRRADRHVAIELPGVGREVCDPVRSASSVLDGIPLPPGEPSVDPGWLADWRAADDLAAAVVAAAVPTTPGPGGDPLRAGSAAAAVWSDLPADGLLLVAASWSVRLIEAFAARRTPAPRVLGNRGTNGIDGLISTAWGAALAHQQPSGRGAPGGPAVALMGDLAFLHDHNGLLAGADEPRPDLTVVVLDNNGGGIFHQLEQGGPDYTGSFERLFGTPQDRDLVAIARAAGVPAARVSDLAGLRTALAGARASGGVSVVVVDVPDRVGEARVLDRVRGRVAELLDRL